MNKRIERRTKYGLLSVGQNVHVLLRPTKFEAEHYKLTGNDVSFYVAWLDEHSEVFNPHILTICGEGFHIDYLPEPEEINVVIYEKEVSLPNTITSEFRPIDMIVEQDAQN